jgi:acyl carrier protein
VTPQQAREQIGLALKRAAPGSDVDAIDPDAELRDALDLDSLDFLQFVEILSETSGRRIDEDDYPELATLNSSIRFLAARLPPGGQDGYLPGTNWVHGESGELAPARSGKSERASRIGRKA